MRCWRRRLSAVDLAQSPAEIVVLSFSDGDLAALAEAWSRDADKLPTLRLASLKKLRHPLSVDLYIDSVVAKARAVIVRCLGGLDYWRYGLERIADVARSRGILLAALPGDDRPDPRLASLSTIADDLLEELDACLREGGASNAGLVLRTLASQLGYAVAPGKLQPLGAIAGMLLNGEAIRVSDLELIADARPAALVVLYRSALVACDVAPVTALMRALDAQGLAPIAVSVTSLKDPAIEPALARLSRPALRRLSSIRPHSPRCARMTLVLDSAGVPVLQAVLAGSARDAWAVSPRGLSATDVAMNVVLPELDGRLLSRAISFKAEAVVDPRLEFATVRHQPEMDRIAYVATLAAGWVRLGSRPRAERQVAIMLSDYPARGGRAGYAVGLDSAASAAAILADLAAAGFDTGPHAIIHGGRRGAI